jgi:hypothetical protein
MVAEHDSALAERVRKNLEILYLHLEVVQSGLIVAAQALHFQNADYDADIARILEHGVGDRLHVQLECLSEMIGELRVQDQDDADGSEREGSALQ